MADFINVKNKNVAFQVPFGKVAIVKFEKKLKSGSKALATRVGFIIKGEKPGSIQIVSECIQSDWNKEYSNVWTVYYSAIQSIVVLHK